MTHAKSFPWLHWLRTVVAWLVTLLLFFPLGWLVLTAFKTELQAISVPPLVLLVNNSTVCAVAGSLLVKYGISMTSILPSAFQSTATEPPPARVSPML